MVDNVSRRAAAAGGAGGISGIGGGGAGAGERHSPGRRTRDHAAATS